jgi:hypothetical protein
MRFYLAGPMSGKPYLNFPAFKFHRERLRFLGHEVFCPAENDIRKYGVDFSSEVPTGSSEEMANIGKKYGLRINDVLAEDLWYICKEAEAIYFMAGWEHSYGARAEWAAAAAVRLEFHYE